MTKLSPEEVNGRLRGELIFVRLPQAPPVLYEWDGYFWRKVGDRTSKVVMPVMRDLAKRGLVFSI